MLRIRREVETGREVVKTLCPESRLSCVELKADRTGFHRTAEDVTYWLSPADPVTGVSSCERKFVSIGREVACLRRLYRL